MIRMTLTVLLVPCATKLLHAIGHHVKHDNNTHKHMYNVDFVHLPTLTSCIYILQTTNYKLQILIQCTSVLIIYRSNLDEIS
jgi:hypothetical protein